MKRKRILNILWIGFLLIFSMIGTAYGEGVSFYPPRPQGNILVSRPSIFWQVILNDNVIESMDMKLDGSKVEGKYNKDLEAVEYIPLEPLKPGRHTVDITLGLKGWAKPLSRSWEFTVSEQAVKGFAPVTVEQKEALDYANKYRDLFGATSFQWDEALSGAASAHAEYMAVNQEVTHVESGKQKGFTGANPLDRAENFGYTGTVISENVSGGQKDYKESIQGLVDAPYHRLSWLNPYFTDMGYSRKDKYYAFLFGGKKPSEEKLVVYPMENQKGIPTGWDGNETPDPLRNHKKKDKIGYPITLSYFTGKTITKFTVEKGSLTNSQGKTIELFINSPQNDEHLKDSIMMIPTTTLDMGEKYTAVVKGTIVFDDKSEKKIDKTWTFETGIFQDIEDHWAKDILQDLASQKVITAKNGAVFKPDDKITRAEFAEFVVNALQLPVKEFEGCFQDVYTGTQKALYIEAAYRAGLVKGFGDGTFAPNRLIAREEMAALVMRAYEKKGDMGKIKQLAPLSFADKESVSGWALNDVKSVAQLGIMRGRLNNRFEPRDYATRAEGAVMIKKLLEVIQ